MASLVIPAKAGIQFLALFLWGLCATAAPLRIVTTTAELHSLVSAVGGDLVSVSHLIPAGQDPESFQPRPQDLARIRDAQAVVRVGMDFDLWLDKLLRQSGNAAVQRAAPGHVDASTDVALLDVRAGGAGPGDGHAHGRGNPHYWLDPANAEMVTATILEALARLDPANAKRYEANRLAFLAELDAKMAQWQRALAPWQGRALIAYHDTWPYLARRFRLRFIGVIETRPGLPASPAHLVALANRGAAEHVAAIVREPHEPRREAEFLASKMGANIAILTSTIGAVPEARDYLSLIDYNVRTLVGALSK